MAHGLEVDVSFGPNPGRLLPQNFKSHSENRGLRLTIPVPEKVGFPRGLGFSII